MAASAARTARAAAARDLRDTVTVGSLEIDRAPVTNRRYAVFVAATDHRTPLTWPKGECPANKLDHPVTGVDFFDALAFALWVDGSLPTEEQWVEAAGLSEPSAYVWGDFFDSKRCNTAKSGIKGTTPVDAYPAGTAPSGCVDLCGNVWEMTCTAFEGDSDSIVVKGGSWSDLPAHARLDTQFRTRVNKGSVNVGFRLVYGVPGFLPHFLDRDLVDQCIGFRKADAPHFDALGDDGEFDAIVQSIRQSAAPHLAKLQAEARAALVGSETGSPAPAGAPFLSRLLAAAREVLNSAFFRKILPVLRVFAKPGRSGSIVDRFRAARAEARRPRRGAPLRQALHAAFATLFPDRGRVLRERIGNAASQLLRRGGARVRMGRAWRVLGGAPAAAGARVKVRGTPPPVARPSMTERVMRNPRRVFVLLCVFAGCVLGLLGTRMRAGEDGARAPAETPPATTAEVEAPRPGLPAGALAKAGPPAPPPVATPAAAPGAKRAEEPAKEIPSVTRELSPEDVRVVMKRLTGGRAQERDEAERFLVWHRSETSAIVRSALTVEQEPELRAALEYVAAAIEEEERPRVDVPTVASSPPQRGLVLFTPSLDAAEEIAMVRRTARAERIDVTVVFTGEGDAARVAKTYGRELGDVRLYADTDGSLAKKLRLERTPAVVGLRDDGKIASIAYGRVQRSRLAEVAKKLRAR
jgi:Sulfatase-modifying factor enzyme 1